MTRLERAQAQALYEFSREENPVFARLATAMKFVGIAKIITGAVVGGGVVALSSSALGIAICSVGAAGFFAMGLLQFAAARHFRRIVATQGHDRDNLMAALVQLTDTYELQRWLWIVLAAVILVALAATTVGWAA